MNEWVRAIVDWFEKTNWLISLLAAIPLSILANIWTPRFQNWSAGRSREKAKKRALEIRNELARLRELSGDQAKLQVVTNTVVLRVLLYLSIGSAIESALPFAYMFAAPIGALFFLVGITEAMRHLRLLRSVAQFAEIEDELQREVEELEKVGK